MVSVCMATYNGARYLREQIDSILAQLSIDDELIISDDGSTDDTCNIIGGYDDPRIRLLRNRGKHGFSSNFGNALSHAKGDYVFLSDQDDVWIAGKYADVLAKLQQYDLVVTDSIVTDEHLNTVHPSFFALYKSKAGLLNNIVRPAFYGSCMAFTRRILHLSLPLCPSLSVGYDQWIGMVACVSGRVLFYDKPYLKYRRLSTSVTTVGSLWTRSKRPLYRKVWDRAVMCETIALFWFSYHFGAKRVYRKH